MSTEILPVAPTGALDKALAAWAEAIETLEPVAAVDAESIVGADAVDTTPPTAQSPAFAGDGFVDRLLADAAVAPSEPALPGADGDAGHESATVQMLSRAPAATNEAGRQADRGPPAGHLSDGKFALPAALLVPVALSGLQVEPATGWPLAQRSEPERPRPAPPRDQPGATAHEDGGRRPHDDRDDAAEESRPPSTDPDAAHGVVMDEADAADWGENLNGTLRHLLTSTPVPPALQDAAAQWRRGRCVVLACPQGADPAGSAWAFVLWPRRIASPGPDGEDAAFALFGLRVEARLQWRSPPPSLAWYHARLIREHHPRWGRQLVSPADDRITDAPLACDVQLGPLLARSPRRCEVRVQVQAAQRFWAALGRQWSVHVAVCAWPLAAARTVLRKAAPC